MRWDSTTVTELGTALGRMALFMNLPYRWTITFGSNGGRIQLVSYNSNTSRISILKKVDTGCALRKLCWINSICHLENRRRFEFTRRRSTSCCQASSSATSRAFTLRESLVSGLKLSSGGSSIQFQRHTSLNAYNAMSDCLYVCTMRLKVYMRQLS